MHEQQKTDHVRERNTQVFANRCFYTVCYAGAMPLSLAAEPPDRRQTGTIVGVTIAEDRHPDSELLTSLHAGDRGAAAMLYDRYAEEVNRIVARLLGVDSEHDDIVQDTFERVFSKSRQVRQPEALRAWIAMVAINIVRITLRKRKLRQAFFAHVEHPPEPATIIDVEARDLLARLYGILDHLPATERIAFVLRYIDDRSIDELAKLCRCSTGTAKRRLRRATARFAELTRQEPGFVEWLESKKSRASS